jgi:hypothetical protein
VVGETATEFLAPSPHRIIRDGNDTLSQEQFDISKTKAEDVVQPDSVTDDLGGNR